MLIEFNVEIKEQKSIRNKKRAVSCGDPNVEIKEQKSIRN